MTTKYRNPIAIFVRNILFHIMMMTPRTRAYLEEDKGKPCATITSGFIDDRSLGSGELFIQPYVRKSGELVLLDKVLSTHPRGH